MVTQYNNARQSSVKMTPVQARDEINRSKVWMYLYPADFAQIKTSLN
jgi:hypothetical protein